MCNFKLTKKNIWESFERWGNQVRYVGRNFRILILFWNWKQHQIVVFEKRYRATIDVKNILRITIGRSILLTQTCMFAVCRNYWLLEKPSRAAACIRLPVSGTPGTLLARVIYIGGTISILYRHHAAELKASRIQINGVWRGMFTSMR